MKPTGPTSIQLRKLISELRRLSLKQKAPFWKVVAKEIERPTRKRREVKIGRIERHTKENETIIVPGKVLSDGELTHKVTVAALKFSEEAKNKINASGKAITIQELAKTNPKAQKVRIIG